ncbi:uncharacterized protein [Lepeophtheirus salmonis]|uniref:uncharacterized protein isoform X2 n=2 Tax=Lepeophtheirus salmonis TaxID=72036 RepID=UPI003AF337B8
MEDPHIIKEVSLDSKGPLGNINTNVGASGSKENICEECTHNPLDLIDASIQVDLSDPEDDSDFVSEDPMGKKRLGGGGDLSKNKKGIPLYSREDIREQYCINEKELHVLDKNQRKSFLGCFTNHNQSGISPCSSGRNRKSLLGSCMARTTSEEDLQKKYEDNLPPPLSPGARSTNTWNARARMYHYGGGYHGVDEEDGFDEHYFRRRPKSFCMLGGPPVPQYLHHQNNANSTNNMGYRYPMDPNLRLSMGSLIETGDLHNTTQYCGAHTLQRYSSTSQYPSSVHIGPPLPATNYYGVSHPMSGNYSIPHGYYPVYSSKEGISDNRTQPNTPDLLIHRRQQNLMESSANSGETSKSLERLIDNGMMHPPPPPPLSTLPNQNSSTADCIYGDTLITQEMARQVMIDRIKRNSMRTQATQTDVNRGLRSELYPENIGKIISPHNRAVQMISEGVQTNGILKPPPPYNPPPPPVRGKQISPHVASQTPGYKLQVYEIDSAPFENNKIEQQIQTTETPLQPASPPSSPLPQLSSSPPPPVPLSPPPTQMIAYTAAEKRNKFQKSLSEGEILEGKQSHSSSHNFSLSQNNLTSSFMQAVDDGEDSDRELPELVSIDISMKKEIKPFEEILSPHSFSSSQECFTPTPLNSSNSPENEVTKEPIITPTNECPILEKTSADIIINDTCSKRKQEMTLNLETPPISGKPKTNGTHTGTVSENSLIWQRGISNGEVKKKKKALEEQIQITSKPLIKTQTSLDSPCLVRSPAMHEGFKVENYIVERTPIHTPEEFPTEEKVLHLESPVQVEIVNLESTKKIKDFKLGERTTSLVEPPTDFADSPIRVYHKSPEEEHIKITEVIVEDSDNVKSPPVVATIRRVRSRSRSRSKERLLAKMAGAAEAPIVSFNEEDDIQGCYVGSYSKTSWAFIGGMNKSYMEEPPKQMARSSSIDSTQSERDFKRRHQAITHRMVHRRSSALMYSRILERSFECNKTVTVQRIRGEFGFRIHGSRPVVISAIEPDTPAQRSGLEVGDIILSINGVNVLDLPHTEVVRTAQTGSDELELGLARVNEESPISYTEKSMEKLDESLKVVSSGYLWKMSRDETKRWIRRWFVIRADSCFYFFKSDEDSRPLGVYLLADSTLHQGNQETHEKTSSYSFKVSWNVSGVVNVLDLAAESQEELDKWNQAISSVSKKTIEEDFWFDIVNQRLSLPCQEFPGKIDASGYLLKLDTDSKSWKKRYCLLCDSCLYLYSDTNSKFALASLCLHGYKVQSTASLGGNKRHAFELMPPLKSLRYFYFVAETETEKKRWLASLEYSLDFWIKVS